MLRSSNVEQISVEHLLGYYDVFKKNDMACPMNPAVMNMRFDNDCIGFFDDHRVWHEGYLLDTKNRPYTALVEYIQSA